LLKLLWVVVVALCVVAVAVLYLVLDTIWETGISALSLSVISSFLILAGVLVALISHIRNITRKWSEDYLDKAIFMIRSAYDTLASKLNENGWPDNDRVRWLTAARLIKTGQGLIRNLTEKSHKEVYKETEHYWRGRLSDLLRPYGDSLPPDYYAMEPEHVIVYSGRIKREPLSLTSLAVIYRFMRWPDGMEDPLNDEPDFTSEEIHKMVTFGPIGLGTHLENVKKAFQRMSK